MGTGGGTGTASRRRPLGVLLYELLTGSTPLTRQRLARAAVLEILRMIREEEPPTPSSRLVTADALPSIAADRSTEPKKLPGLVRGELDWVVMRCLEKDRSRRYDTANGLARDVERYLADEPVEAGRPTAGYRLRKFARRHRRPLAAAAAFAALLVAAAVVSTWQAVRATTARNDKQKAFDLLEQEQTKTADALAKSEKARAGLDAIQTFYSAKILQAGRPKGAENGLGKDVLLRQAIDAAVAALDTAFPGQPEVEAAVRHKLAESYNFMDELGLAVTHYQTALALRERHLPPDHADTLQTLNDIGVVHYNARRFPEALALHERVLAARRKEFGHDSLEAAESLRNLTAVYYFLRRYDDALKAAEEVVRVHRGKLDPLDTQMLRSLNNLAAMYSKVGSRPDAVRIMEELVAARRRLDADPATASLLNTHMVMYNLAKLYLDTGRPADALRVLGEFLPQQRANLPAGHTDLLDTLFVLGDAYVAAGRPGYACWAYAEVAAARRRQYPPGDSRIREVFGSWARACLNAGRPGEAERHFAEQVAAAGRYAAAEPYLRECLAARERSQPGGWRAADARSRLGGTLAGQRRFAEAEPLLLAGYETLKAGYASLTAGNKATPADQARLADAAGRLAALFAAWDKPTAAVRWRAERALYPAEVAPPPREAQ